MKKLNIALVTGGDVAERGISLLSAKTVASHLDQKKYEVTLLDYQGGKFRNSTNGFLVDLNDFTIEGKSFDLVFLMLHGHPAEDGELQGYFNMLKIPVTGCDVFSSGLTFAKQACKDYLRNYEIPMAPSKMIRKESAAPVAEVEDMQLPLFVKPNKNGSSYGVTMVTKANQLSAAIDKAFQFDDEIIVEGYLKGKEFSNGVFRKKGKTVVMPITEIVPQTDFFDYDAKYKNLSDEITPARLTKSQTIKCQALTKKLYELLGCAGICRADFILVDEEFYFLEINTIPGMSPNSLVPQQARAMNLPLTELYDAVIEEALGRAKS